MWLENVQSYLYSRLLNKADAVARIPWLSLWQFMPKASFCKHLQLLPEGFLSDQVWAGWKCQNSNISGSGPWVMMELEIKSSSFPQPSVQFWVRCHTVFQDCSAGPSLRCPQVTGRTMQPLPDCFLSLSHCSLPSSVSWVTSKLNYTHINPCFRVCFCGSPN